ncbi:DUF397 domain-containing protein [Actinoallomurus acaciae]|uniref:DUF397 domain-containing protein n=1 Tax=Actinoallomurus acaciae TaxID=502577 RepID=A0ABV5YGK7_9ACTN
MTSPVWRKSSWTSDGTTNNCVEVAELPSAVVEGERGGHSTDGVQAERWR